MISAIYTAFYFAWTRLYSELLTEHQKTQKYLFSPLKWSIILWLPTSLISRKTGLLHDFRLFVSAFSRSLARKFCMCTWCVQCVHCELCAHTAHTHHTHKHHENTECSLRCRNCRIHVWKCSIKFDPLPKYFFHSFASFVHNRAPYKLHLMNYLNSLSALVGIAARWFLFFPRSALLLLLLLVWCVVVVNECEKNVVLPKQWVKKKIISNR